MNDEIYISGIVENIVYQNTINGYCVFEVSLSENEGVDLESAALETGDLEKIVCTGNVFGIVEGESTRIFGRYMVHPTYGRQFSVSLYEKLIPKTQQGVLKYLGSGLIKGIRERLAKKIVERFGDDTLRVIEDFPEKLTEIKGISLDKAMMISAILHEQVAMRRVIVYLQDLGISSIFATKIYKKYKDNTIPNIQKNPYRLADEIIGIGFKLADSIAEKAGMAKDSPERVEASVKFALNSASNNGHVFLPKNMLLEHARELVSLPIEIIENSLAKMQLDRTIWQELYEGSTNVYLNNYYYAENNVAKKLLELAKTVVKKGKNAESELDSFESENKIFLASKQRQAVLEALDNGVLIITGGPGTGKTTTINTIINLLNHEDYEIELAAPTGRAAKRMSEATGLPAKTIHRLLEISFEGEGARIHAFGKNKDNPIEADVIIIDESSMVDILLMNSLLSAIAPGTRLILVGDVDQLPSVGPGNVLKDIIFSGCLPIVRLDEVFRQAQQSAIVMNAHRINKGEYPVINDTDSDFFFTTKNTVDDVLQTVIELVTTRLPKFIKSTSMSDIQVLAPMRKSPLGVANLNTLLQAKLNPKSDTKAERPFRQITFREGDKVMQIKNNYNMTWRMINSFGKQTDEGLGIFNGDTGLISRIDNVNEVITVRFDDEKCVDYDFMQLDELELSYAITIHKSQGSEYKVVVIPIHSGAPMLMSRNLLYTGITRAKNLTVLVGLPEMLRYMVDNNREVSRFTSLNRRIIKMHERFFSDTII